MNNHITIIIKTFLRPIILGECIKSIRKYYPYIKIIVADDSDKKSITDQQINMLINEYYMLSFDCGLSYGRNFLIDKVHTKYVMLIDDDTIFTKDTNLFHPYHILENTEIDLVSGCIKDKTYNNKLYYVGTFNINHERKLIIDIYKHRSIMNNGFPLYDLCANFFIAKTDIIRKIKWNNKLKICEHTEFFIRAKKHKIKCTALPYFIAINTHARNKRYNKFRIQRYTKYYKMHHQIIGVIGQEKIKNKNIDYMQYNKYANERFDTVNDLVIEIERYKSANSL